VDEVVNQAAARAVVAVVATRAAARKVVARKVAGLKEGLRAAAVTAATARGLLTDRGELEEELASFDTLAVAAEKSELVTAST
jgi:hypothetical protein